MKELSKKPHNYIDVKFRDFDFSHQIWSPLTLDLLLLSSKMWNLYLRCTIFSKCLSTWNRSVMLFWRLFRTAMIIPHWICKKSSLLFTLSPFSFHPKCVSEYWIESEKPVKKFQLVSVNAYHYSDLYFDWKRILSGYLSLLWFNWQPLSRDSTHSHLRILREMSSAWIILSFPPLSNDNRQCG